MPPAASFFMKSDKEIKRWFKEKASRNPDEYYATSILKQQGFKRRQCSCGTWFWTVTEQQHCGDASCAGGFTLFTNNPSTKELDYVAVWQEFSKMFAHKGYTPVSRYPVVARWNPTMDFTIASIAAFQPYVVSGEVDPPAKRLVIPQFCLRFGDVDNVGVTMSHMTGFVMIGQHMFLSPKEWSQETAFKDIMDWLTEGLGLPLHEITFHEDAWAGGGNFGPCMEYFSRGVELGNQVYMMYEQDGDASDGYVPLPLKVLDMGMGMERNAWFSQGKGTIYDATFPTVVQELLQKTKVEYPEELMHKYIPVAAFLNLDEVDDITEAWERVSNEVGIPAETLRERIAPMTAIYSIAEHARSLLFALADGGLPSNVGGGYNLRVVFRRAQGFIDKYKWNVDLGDVCAWHASYLKPIFPELHRSMPDVRKILEVEKRKHCENKKRAAAILEKISSKDLTTETLISLYDAHGIPPEEVKRAAAKAGKNIHIPDNFFALVAESHEQREQQTATRKKDRIPVGDVPNTQLLYFDNYDYVDFKSAVLVANGTYVVLERTAFYPTSGGQQHDTGTIDGVKVIDVVKQDGVVVHIMEKSVDWQQGKIVVGHIDIDRRVQLAQHHTATHIINGAARKVLGNHVWQAGAAKMMEKARIDITHYDTLSDEELQVIEKEANKIVHQNLPVNSVVQPKNVAEQDHGFRLYQGGAVPGKDIRVVEIPDFDVEACGGTHLHTTGEARAIKILKSTKVQDGIIRIEFTAGEAAINQLRKEKQLVQDIAGKLGVAEENIPAAVDHLFSSWKKVRKAVKKGKEIDWNAMDQPKLDVSDKEPIQEAARILQTQPEHVLATIERFKKDIAKVRSSPDSNSKDTQ